MAQDPWTPERVQTLLRTIPVRANDVASALEGLAVLMTVHISPLVVQDYLRQTEGLPVPPVAWFVRMGGGRLIAILAWMLESAYPLPPWLAAAQQSHVTNRAVALLRDALDPQTPNIPARTTELVENPNLAAAGLTPGSLATAAVCFAARMFAEDVTGLRDFLDACMNKREGTGDAEVITPRVSVVDCAGIVTGVLMIINGDGDRAVPDTLSVAMNQAMRCVEGSGAHNAFAKAALRELLLHHKVMNAHWLVKTLHFRSVSSEVRYEYTLTTAEEQYKATWLPTPVPWSRAYNTSLEALNTFIYGAAADVGATVCSPVWVGHPVTPTLSGVLATYVDVTTYGDGPSCDDGDDGRSYVTESARASETGTSDRSQWGVNPDLLAQFQAAANAMAQAMSDAQGAAGAVLDVTTSEDDQSQDAESVVPQPSESPESALPDVTASEDDQSRDAESVAPQPSESPVAATGAGGTARRAWGTGAPLGSQAFSDVVRSFPSERKTFTVLPDLDSLGSASATKDEVEQAAPAPAPAASPAPEAAPVPVPAKKARARQRKRSRAADTHQEPQVNAFSLVHFKPEIDRRRKSGGNECPV